MKTAKITRELTEKAVTAATFDPDGPGVQYLWDGKTTGFGVRLYPSGRKSFVVAYRSSPDSRMRFTVIGKVGQKKVRQAREEAGIILAGKEDSVVAFGDQEAATAQGRHRELARPSSSSIKGGVLIEKRRVDRRVGERRTGGFDKTVADHALIVDDRQKLVRIKDRKVRLTPKEFRLMRLLASEPGRVFSTTEIIKDAWASDSRASVEDVQQYVHLLRKKVEVDPKRPQLIVTFHGFGYGLELSAPK